MNKIKEFFVEYGGIIGKIIVNHIAMAIFGIVVLIAANGIGRALFHVAGAIAILLYMLLLYMILWELGSKHNVKVYPEGEKPDKLLGLKISLAANSLFILAGIIIFVLSFFTNPDEVTNVNNVCGILKIAMNYLNGMYLSISSLAPGFGAMHLLLTLPSLVCCTFSYLAGLSGMKCIIPDKKKKK